MQEGGESRLDTNINAFLEQVGISVNGDSVIRKHFYKYLHPKEAFVGNGVLNKELVRVAKGEAKQANSKAGKYAKRYAVNKDDLVERDENGGLKFVYPYGATLNVNRPAVPIMSSGPISFPANRPIDLLKSLSLVCYLCFLIVALIRYVLCKYIYCII